MILRMVASEEGYDHGSVVVPSEFQEWMVKRDQKRADWHHLTSSSSLGRGPANPSTSVESRMEGDVYGIRNV